MFGKGRGTLSKGILGRGGEDWSRRVRDDIFGPARNGFSVKRDGGLPARLVGIRRVGLTKNDALAKTTFSCFVLGFRISFGEYPRFSRPFLARTT